MLYTRRLGGSAPVDTSRSSTLLVVRSDPGLDRELPSVDVEAQLSDNRWVNAPQASNLFNRVLYSATLIGG